MKNFQLVFDKSAMGLSVLCMVHCLVFPVIATVLPVIVALGLADESFHQLLLIGILPISIVALMLGCRRHRTWAIMFWGMLGLSILIATVLLGHEVLGENGEKIATIIGSVVIVYSHFRNYRLCNSHHCEC